MKVILNDDSYENVLFSKELALKYLNNNEEIYKRLIQRFYLTYKDVNEKIKKDFFEKNFSEVKRVIHDIKGISLNIGSGKLYKITSIINDSFNQGFIDDEEIMKSISLNLNCFFDLISEVLTYIEKS